MIALVLATVADILEAIASAAIMERIASIFTPVTNVLATIKHILSTIPHVLATVPNVFASVTPIFKAVSHDSTVRTSMRMSALRTQGRGRCSNHQGCGKSSHSEIAHRIPQRQNLAPAVVTCAAHSTPPHFER